MCRPGGLKSSQGGSVSTAQAHPNGITFSISFTGKRNVKRGISSLPSKGVDGVLIWLFKLLRVPPLTQMTVRVRSNAIELSYLEPRSSTTTRQGVPMTNSIAELEPRKEFDVLVTNFSRTDRTFLKHNAIGHSKRSPLALNIPSRATSEQYTRILPIPSNAVHDTPHTSSASPTKSQHTGTTSFASPPAWQDQVDLPHLHDKPVWTQILVLLPRMDWKRAP